MKTILFTLVALSSTASAWSSYNDIDLETHSSTVCDPSVAPSTYAASRGDCFVTARSPYFVFMSCGGTNFYFYSTIKLCQSTLEHR